MGGFWVLSYSINLFYSIHFIFIFSREYLIFIKYSLLLGFCGFFWGPGSKENLHIGTRSTEDCESSFISHVPQRTLLSRWYALYLLHVGGRGDLIPCAGYRLITRNLSPHSPPLKFPPSLRRIYSLTRNIK